MDVKRININYLMHLLLLLFIIFTRNTYLDFSPLIALLFKAISIIIFIFLLIKYILNKKYSSFTILFLLYFSFGMFSSALGEYASISNYLNKYLNILTIIMYFDLFIKKDCKNFLLSLEKILYIMVLINFISIILYPDGLFKDALYSNNWFLLYDNLHICTYIPALVVSMICKNYRNKKIDFYIVTLIIMITYSVFYCFSANSVIAYSFLMIYIIFRNYINKIKFFNIVSYLMIYFGIFIFIIHMRLQNIFKSFIVDVLHKDLTFSTRTILWDRIMFYITRNPMLGYGVESGEIFTLKMGNAHYTHAHNTIYDIIYKGGILSFLLFILIIVSASKKLYKFRNNSIAKLIAFSLFTFFIMINFEARQEKIGFWIILSLAYFIEYIIQDVKKQRAKE